MSLKVYAFGHSPVKATTPAPEPAAPEPIKPRPRLFDFAKWQVWFWEPNGRPEKWDAKDSPGMWAKLGLPVPKDRAQIMVQYWRTQRLEVIRLPVGTEPPE